MGFFFSTFIFGFILTFISLASALSQGYRAHDLGLTLETHYGQTLSPWGWQDEVCKGALSVWNVLASPPSLPKTSSKTCLELGCKVKISDCLQEVEMFFCSVEVDMHCPVEMLAGRIPHIHNGSTDPSLRENWGSLTSVSSFNHLCNE